MAEKIGRAPGDLGVLQSFVNTLDIEQSTDGLSDTAALQSWLEQAGLCRDGDGLATSGGRRAEHKLHRPAAADLAAAIELREVLRKVLRSHVTHGPAGADADAGQDAAAELRAISARLPTRLEVGDDGRIRAAAAGSGAAGRAGPDPADRR